MKNLLYPLVLALAVWGLAADEESDLPPPVPIPTSAILFDVDQNGICDSVAITYSRPIHVDSVPIAICLMWDSASMMAVDPYREGISNSHQYSELFCNALVSDIAYYVDCSKKDANGYCSNMVTIGGLRLSDDVKATGVGKVYSFAEFVDKGKIVRIPYTCDMVNPNPTALRSKAVPLKSGLTEYTVMDLQGRVVRRGLAAGVESIIANFAPGSYILKLGDDVFRMNIR